MWEEATVAQFERCQQQLRALVALLGRLQAALVPGPQRKDPSIHRSPGTLGGTHGGKPLPGGDLLGASSAQQTQRALQLLGDVFAAVSTFGRLLVPPEVEGAHSIQSTDLPADGRGAHDTLATVAVVEAAAARTAPDAAACPGSPSGRDGSLQLRSQIAVLRSQLEDAQFEAAEMRGRAINLEARLNATARAQGSSCAGAACGDGELHSGGSGRGAGTAAAAAVEVQAVQQRAEALSALVAAQSEAAAAKQEVEVLRQVQAASREAAEALQQHNVALQRALEDRCGDEAG